MNRFGLSLVALSALLATLLAGAIIWLIFAQPVIVIDVVSEQDITPVVRELAELLAEAVRTLLRFL